ncbi:YfiT family bacillithiol transferase [Evansella tamaricis]|nr:bacillithiol transferase BstA [Evansella tamaricis]
MDERYPIGKFNYDGEISTDVLQDWINKIEELPERLRKAIEHLKDEQLDTPYRKDGWTIRQVVHHLADSHMNAFIRLKLALTEESPVIKPYDETEWAELTDSALSVESSLLILTGLHHRWANLLQSLSPTDLEKLFVHPELGEVPIKQNIGMYAWHSNHHLAHITNLCKQMDW